MRKVHEKVSGSNVVSQELSISERNVFQHSFVVLTFGKESLNKLLFGFARGVWQFFAESRSHWEADTTLWFLPPEQEQQNRDVPKTWAMLQSTDLHMDFQEGGFQLSRKRELLILNIYPHLLLPLDFCLPGNFWFKPVTCFLGLRTCCKLVRHKIKL